MNMPTQLRKPLYQNVLLRVYAPAAIFLSYIVLSLVLSAEQLKPFIREDGVYETIQFFTLFAALIVFVRTLIGFPLRAHPWLAAYVVLAIVCTFYVAGEEISWGQRVFGWATPDTWKAINDHGETNLHNTTKWIDEKPKVLLAYLIMIGGIIVPLLHKRKAKILPVRFEKIYPPMALIVAAACLAALKILKPIDSVTHFLGFERSSEVMELQMYYFVFLYALFLKATLKVEPYIAAVI